MKIEKETMGLYTRAHMALGENAIFLRCVVEMSVLIGQISRKVDGKRVGPDELLSTFADTIVAMENLYAILSEEAKARLSELKKKSLENLEAKLPQGGQS